jgi:Tfp pilus assembly protein FimT
MVGQNRKSGPHRKHHFRGITLVEIFVALGALAIMLSFAAAPLERISARADVDIARENIVNALTVAQRSAVRAHVPVRVYLSESASFDRPHLQLAAGYSPLRGAVDFYPLPNYALPAHVTVTLSAGMSVIEYLPAGNLVAEGVITLSSETNPGYVIDLRIDDSLTLRAPASPQGRRALQ